MAKKLTLKDFIKKSREIHGDKYDYSSSTYINSSTKTYINCPIHGIFKQLPSSHLMGNGCPKCANEEKGRKKTNTKDNFIMKAKEIHKDKYNYSKVEYVNNHTKTCIVCPKHGEFLQTPNNHLNGQGCPHCSLLRKSDKVKLNTSDFISKAKLIHRDKYDYSKVNYIGSKDKICIICPKHGEFWQTPNSHLQGQGCPKCVGLNKTNDEWINEARVVHHDKYDYSNVNYINAKTKVNIICPIHGEFSQIPSVHLNGHGCPKCGNLFSNAENEIFNFLSILQPQQGNRTILKNNEIDIYIPSLKLGIEYNGLLWHSELYNRDKHYHLDKLIECNNKGVELMQIFEDEWFNNKEICKYNLLRLCNLDDNLIKISTTKCQIKEIKDKELIKDFLEKNDINGSTKLSIGLGAYCNGNLIYLMSFLRDKRKWILNRCTPNIKFCSNGIEKRILEYFVSVYKPSEIITFADRRWTICPQNNLFTQIGFIFDTYTPPNSYFYNTNIRFKRLKKKEDYETDKYTKIWDCGCIKYKYVI